MESFIQWQQAMLPNDSGGLGLGIHPMVPSAAFAASFYVAYPGIYSAHPGIAEEVARAAAIVTANPPADLPQQPPDGEFPLALDYVPVLDFAVAVARLM
jgi:hypothetical protein